MKLHTLYIILHLAASDPLVLGTRIVNIHNYVNMFSNCQIFLINYMGADISEGIRIPLVLLRYFVHYKDPKLVPIEFKSKPDLKNRTKSNDILVEYVGVIDNPIIMFGKRIRCKALIYSEPTYPHVNRKLYEHYEYGTYLREPYIYSHFEEYRYSQDRHHVYRTSSTYFVLVKNITLSDINLDSIYISWSISLWWTFQLPVENNHYIVLRTRSIVNHSILQKSYAVIENQTLEIVEHFVACFHCKRCSKVELVELKDFSNLLNLKYLTNLHGKPDRIHVRVRWSVPKVDMTSRKTYNQFLRQIQMLREYNPDQITSMVDVYFISTIIQANTTLKMSRSSLDLETERKWNKAKDYKCNLIEQQLDILPQVAWTASKYIWKFQHHSLRLHHIHLGFVSCHFRETLWMANFAKLVDAFDVSTWIAFFSFLYVTSYLTNSAVQFYKTEHIDKMLKKKSFFLSFFHLISLSLDQGVSHLNYPAVRNKIFYFPLTMWLLGNAFKGFSITELTVPPTLIRFDTFDKLVSNHFNIFSIPRKVGRVGMQQLLGDGQCNCYRSKHEAFPIVSEFWSYIMKPFDTWKRLSDMEIDNTTQVYLKHSEIFPEWQNFSVSKVGDKTYNALVIPHMLRCDRSAVIIDHVLKQRLYSQLKYLDFPAYVGKEMLIDLNEGYRLIGAVSRNIIVRASNVFEAGILNWWTEFIINLSSRMATSDKWVQTRGGEALVGAQRRRKIDLKIISLTPAFGLILALLIFCLELLRRYKLSKKVVERVVIQQTISDIGSPYQIKEVEDVKGQTSDKNFADEEVVQDGELDKMVFTSNGKNNDTSRSSKSRKTQKVNLGYGPAKKREPKDIENSIIDGDYINRIENEVKDLRNLLKQRDVQIRVLTDKVLEFESGKP